MSRVVSSACIRTPSSKLRRYGFTSRCTMFTSGFPLARPCEIRVQSIQAIVRALSGKSAATLALSRPKMTNVRLSGQRKYPCQLFRRSVTETGWQQAGRVEVGMRNLVLDLPEEVQVLEDCVWNVVAMGGVKLWTGMCYGFGRA